MSGTLYVVATPIGNLEDLSMRALRVLREVDLIVCEDTRHTRKLLARFDVHTPLTSFFKGNENEKARSIVGKILGGASAALVSDGGTPCISDPGYPLLRLAVENGVKIVPIPGASALTCSLCAAGLPTERITFAGFLPDKPGKRSRALAELAGLDHTLVFYIPPWKAAAVLRSCIEALGDRPACLCREMTKVHEEFRRGMLSEILISAEERAPKGEMTLIVSGKGYSR